MEQYVSISFLVCINRMGLAIRAFHTSLQISAAHISRHAKHCQVTFDRLFEVLLVLIYAHMLHLQTINV